MININRAARLEWRPYSKFSGAPEGAVAGVDESSAGSASGDRDIFIGRHLSSDTGRYRPGTVEVPRRSSRSSFGSMAVFDETVNSIVEYSNGDVLVEVEPVRYELDILDESDERTKRRRKLSRQDTILSKSSLFRFDEGRDLEARLQKVLSYNFEKSEYYGQVITFYYLKSFCILPPFPKKNSIWYITFTNYYLASFITVKRNFL